MKAEGVAAASAEHSRFVQRVRRRYEAERALLAPGLPDAAAVNAVVAAPIAPAYRFQSSFCDVFTCPPDAILPSTASVDQ